MNRDDMTSMHRIPRWPAAAALAVWLAGCAPASQGTDPDATRQMETTASHESSGTAAASEEVPSADASGAAAAPAAPEDPGRRFLADNAKREGVVATASGLQYEVLVSGNGATPGPTDIVTTHYHGTFVDGRIFDSSVNRGEPASFPVDGVIQGWTEALAMMKVGDKWKIVCPPELAYGERGRRGIPPSSTLIFEIELLDVKPSG